MTTMNENIDADAEEIISIDDAAADRDVEASIAITVKTNPNPDSENAAADRRVLANVSRQQRDEHSQSQEPLMATMNENEKKSESKNGSSAEGRHVRLTKDTIVVLENTGTDSGKDAIAWMNNSKKDVNNIDADDEEIPNNAAAAATDRDVEAAIDITTNTNTNPDSENAAADRSVLANVLRQQSDEHTQSLAQSLRTIPGAYAVNNPLFESSRSSSAITDDDINNTDHNPSTLSRSYTASVTRTTLEMTSTLSSLQETSYYNGDNNSNSHSHSQHNGLCIVQAVRIDNEKVYNASIVEHDEDRPSGSIRRMWRCVGIAVVLLLVMVIALSVVLSTKQRQQQLIQGEYNDGVLLASTSTTVAPLMMDNDDINNSYSWDFGQRRDSMLAIVAPISGGDDIFDIDSPDASPDRIAALQWLVEKDPLRINTDTDTDTDTIMPQWKIRQRYVLVLLYIATIGKGWENQYKFLSGLDECQWNTVRTQIEGGVGSFAFNQNFEVKGAICNDKGKIAQFKMWWNNMSGTLPHELSIFSEDIDTMNFGGGSLSGPIPNSFDRFTKLETLLLNDNCLSGTVPEDMYRIPTLTIFTIYNNNELSGSLNGFCDGGGNLTEGMISIIGDCAGSSGTVECDCCTCCDYDNYECTHSQSGESWPSYYLDGLTAKGYVKSFDKPQQCISDQQEQWIQEECPCVVNISTDLNRQPFLGQCTKDCTTEGAIRSYDY